MSSGSNRVRFFVLLVVGAAVFTAGFFGRELTEQKGKSYVYFLPTTLLADDKASTSVAATPAVNPAPPVASAASSEFEYIEVTDGCGPYWGDGCLHMRSGPGTEYPIVMDLRNGMVLKSGGAVTAEGRTWYKVVFDEWLRYPERMSGEHYVDSEYIRPFLDSGPHELTTDEAPSGTKKIVVDRSKQMLYAYDGDTLFMQEPISTGLEMTPTPQGTFTIYRKSPTRYMQGPLPDVSDQYYDLPGVPWDLYFTHEGGVIHGAYWHDKFGQPWSHGCVNLSPPAAHELYEWAELGTPVIVKD